MPSIFCHLIGLWLVFWISRGCRRTRPSTWLRMMPSSYGPVLPARGFCAYLQDKQIYTRISLYIGAALLHKSQSNRWCNLLLDSRRHYSWPPLVLSSEFSPVQSLREVTPFIYIPATAHRDIRRTGCQGIWSRVQGKILLFVCALFDLVRPWDGPTPHTIALGEGEFIGSSLGVVVTILRTEEATWRRRPILTLAGSILVVK